VFLHVVTARWPRLRLNGAIVGIGGIVAQPAGASQYLLGPTRRYSNVVRASIAERQTVLMQSHTVEVAER